MKAALHQNYGSPNAIEIKEAKIPTPKDNEVLVRVCAATVNRTDCAMLRARPFIMRFVTGFFKPKNQISGTDFAGQVEAIGKAVSTFCIGDKVFGFYDLGTSSHAEYLAFNEQKGIAKIPENITFDQAAASLEGAHYAYNIINKLTIRSGEKVLVNGASGAIGSASVQLLKHLGLEVTAVCNTKNLELMRSIGADNVIDFTKEDFTKTKDRFHYIFDTVGKSTFARCKPLLLSQGVYISSELGPMIQNPFLALITPILGRKKVVFPIPLDIRASVLLIKDLLASKKFIPVIDRSYPLEQISDAFHYVETGQKTGNVLLHINHN
ncbi:MAG: NADPH:quinone reductase-like Zn-dependent oxidoreductase [Cyclobacteriaceae bacterium]|jgi:NADPH:quinone reductase-like Zn-dependent oxidoreductase